MSSKKVLARDMQKKSCKFAYYYKYICIYLLNYTIVAFYIIKLLQNTFWGFNLFFEYFFTELLEMAVELSGGFGKVLRLFFGSKLLVFLTQPEDIEVR